jgi:hypothetical protein
MKPRLVTAAVCLSLLGYAAVSSGKDRKPKPGPLSGTWECTSRGGPQGQMPFTLLLKQFGETVTGSVTSPIGGTQISSASFKNKTLDIKIDTDDGTYLLTARLKNGKLAGSWSNQSQRGTWQGSKQDQMDP